MIFHSSKEWTVTVAHILGFPRIGAERELKAALESFWQGELTESGLLKVGRDLRGKHWQWQRSAGLDLVTVGDFAWYDSVLGFIGKYLGASSARTRAKARPASPGKRRTEKAALRAQA